MLNKEKQRSNRVSNKKIFMLHKKNDVPKMCWLKNIVNIFIILC